MAARKIGRGTFKGPPSIQGGHRPRPSSPPTRAMEKHRDLGRGRKNNFANYLLFELILAPIFLSMSCTTNLK